ncbi:hypothetical protein DFH27DRAFT_609403 [Peziza echinospora]|nr:hypothetical protein DFH27DRAFT_609403 [Peziza echinospora]
MPDSATLPRPWDSVKNTFPVNAQRNINLVNNKGKDPIDAAMAQFRAKVPFSYGAPTVSPLSNGGGLSQFPFDQSASQALQMYENESTIPPQIAGPSARPSKLSGKSAGQTQTMSNLKSQSTRKKAPHNVHFSDPEEAINQLMRKDQEVTTTTISGPSTKAGAAPAPAKPTPAPAKPTPAPAKPAPAPAKPAPAQSKPTPAQAKPTPMAAKPAPVAPKPAPVLAKPVPTLTTARPTLSAAGQTPAGSAAKVTPTHVLAKPTSLAAKPTKDAGEQSTLYQRNLVAPTPNPTIKPMAEQEKQFKGPTASAKGPKLIAEPIQGRQTQRLSDPIETSSSDHARQQPGTAASKGKMPAVSNKGKLQLQSTMINSTNALKPTSTNIDVLPVQFQQPPASNTTRGGTRIKYVGSQKRPVYLLPRNLPQLYNLHSLYLRLRQSFAQLSNQGFPPAKMANNAPIPRFAQPRSAHVQPSNRVPIQAQASNRTPAQAQVSISTVASAGQAIQVQKRKAEQAVSTTIVQASEAAQTTRELHKRPAPKSTVATRTTTVTKGQRDTPTSN